MPKKKGKPVGSKTLIVRVNGQTDEDLRTAAEGLGLDVSNLVRLIFVEQLPVYIERGRDARIRAESARLSASESSAVKKGRPRAKPKPSDSDEEVPSRNIEL